MNCFLWLLLIGGGIWMFYMATFRTDQWLKLVEDNRQRNRNMLGGAMKVGGMAWRAYRRFK